jgi:DNA-binding IclR family transcriptional regulator
VAGNSIEEGRSVTNKVSSILLTFTRGGEHSLTEISKLAGLPVSTAHRLANELASLRVLERTPDGLYRAGLSLRTIGAVNAYPPTLAERAPYVLEDLSEIARCRARLGVLQDLEVAYIEKRPDAGTVTSFTSRATLPAHPTALGRALLAFAPPCTVERVIIHGLRAYTKHTVTATERFRHLLAVTRLTRVAVSRQEFEADVCGVAMPVFGPGGHIVAAIELAVVDLDAGLKRNLLDALLIASRSLSRELACEVPAVPASATGLDRLHPIGLLDVLSDERRNRPRRFARSASP